MRWKTTNVPIRDNRYRYNGKEEQEFVNLPYTDYGARMRNPAIPGWNGFDPLAEQTPGISPYALCNNNPIKHVDPDGLSAQPAGADSMQVVPIAPVTVEAPRLNPAGRALAFIMWGLSGWGELLNDASGNTNTSFAQNMQTGMDFWSSMTVGYGLSKLRTVKTAKVAKNGQKQIKWTFGKHKTSQKWINQMRVRGWTEKQISEAIANGSKIKAVNLVNKNNPATRYVHPETGKSVVIDDITHELLHVGGSDFNY